MNWAEGLLALNWVHVFLAWNCFEGLFMLNWAEGLVDLIELRI